MKIYKVVYQEYKLAPFNRMEVEAMNSKDAYIKAQECYGWALYGAYVEGYTTKSGRFHYFHHNVMGGKPY